jgi:hypothetical protein
VEPGTKAIHTIKMLNDRVCVGQCAAAIWAQIAKPLAHQISIFRIVNLYRPRASYFSAHLVQAHADQLVGNIRFRASCCKPQFGNGVSHFVPFPRSQSTDTPSTVAKALSS